MLTRALHTNQAALFTFGRYSYHAELKFELSDNLPAVHLQVKTPCKGTAILTNIETDKGENSYDLVYNWFEIMKAKYGIKTTAYFKSV